MSIASEKNKRLSGAEKRQLLAQALAKKASHPKSFPVSFAQQRLWFLNQLEPDSPAYNIPISVRLRGTLSVEALARSLNVIVQRHESLRTTFEVVAGQPRQIISVAVQVPIPIIDLSTCSETVREAEARRLADDESHRAFNLTRGPLIRATLLRLGGSDHVALLTIHHIVSDGWSTGVLIRELAALYDAFSHQRPSPLAELPIQYGDFATWQRNRLQGARLGEQLTYWTQQLAGRPTTLDLPTDYPRPAIQTFQGAQRTLKVSRDLTEALNSLARQEGATLFMTLLAVFQTLLHRYTNQDNILIGTPIANRNRKEIEDLIGFFVNTLVLHTDLSGNPSFRDLLSRVREVALGAYAHQDMPFEQIIEALHPRRDLSRNPLFQVMFNLLNFEEYSIELPELRVEFFPIPESGSKFDLTLYAHEYATGLWFKLVYNADLFSAERMQEMLAQFEQLLHSVVRSPDTPINEFSIVTPAAQECLPDVTAPLQAAWSGAAHALFAQQARRVANQVAVKDDRAAWTYGELEARSNQLAHYLLASGVQSQEVVAIYGHRSAALVWALLGVLKAGAAFLILDPAYPAARLIDYVSLAKPHAWVQIAAAGPPPNDLEDVIARLPLRCRAVLPSTAEPAEAEGWAAHSTAEVQVPVAPDDLAYIAFTSGSTGKPKGILGSHRPLAHFVTWHTTTFGLRETDRFGLLSGLSHDPVLRDIFTPLSLGATLCIPNPELMRAAGWLAAWVRRESISVIHLTPALGQLLVSRASETAAPAQLASLRYAFYGGDLLTRWDVRQLQTLARSVVCVNFYGTTETPQAMAYFIVPRDAQGQKSIGQTELIPLGQGITGVQLLVLTPTQQLAGIGEIGEIYVRTPYLTRGYLDDDALTQARFIPNPFSRAPGPAPEDRLYRTGDLGRYRPDGLVEFLGRADAEIKIRGFRIDLAEIKAALIAHPAIHEAAVVAVSRSNSGDAVSSNLFSARDKQLVAYVVPEQPHTLSITELRRFLQARLPDYMVPSAYVRMEALPLTPNGKLDQSALPAPVAARPEAEDLAPATEIERQIAAIWQEVLGIDRVGVHDNFFDLGGHSLLLVQVHSKLQTILRRELPVLDLFKYPTVQAIASHLSEPKTGPLAPQRRQGAHGQGSVDQRETAIAIVGMTGRFPGAQDIDELWHHLCQGVESILPFSDEELVAAGVDPALLSNPNYVKSGALVDRIELFDASFFGLTPREAEILDPQQRLFLECAWEALELAGCDSETYPGRIGVYAGSGISSYLLFNIASNRELLASVGNFQTVISNDKDYLATRVSYKLNLTGPSINVQTACSTSLVAVCLAAQGLLSGQCDVALAGGVTIRMLHRQGYFYQEGGIYAPDGHCRAFDRKAHGTVPGNGVAVAVLKRLDDAIADGDRIHAVLKGFGLNNDGAWKVGFTAPSVRGQSQAIGDALDMAGVSPETIGYVEAHGTGTPLGDPIEIAALSEVYKARTEKQGFCAIGSVKTNIGHLDTAAGVAGLIKAILVLENKLIPPSLHFEEPNPQIEFQSSPFYVAQKLTEWPVGTIPRRAGVSSFGIGGTNAHVVLEEAPTPIAGGESRPWQLIMLSAKTDSALDSATQRLSDYLKQHSELNLADAAFTLQTGRRAFDHRRLIMGRTVEEVISALDGLRPERAYTHTIGTQPRPVVFMFPGQGTQFVNMGLEIYAAEPVFRTHIEQCAKLLEPHLGLDLCSVLYPAGDSEAAARKLNQTQLTQPALFVIEYALAQLWLSWGVKPQAFIGHSIGEYVAACLAGVFSLEDALALVAMRGRLTQVLPAGAMLSLPLAEAEARQLLGEHLSLAAVNAPELSVAAGPIAEIEALENRLQARGVACRRLHTSHAFHSAMLDPILDPFTDFVRTLKLSPPQVPYLSNVTGHWITAEEATDPQYWARHLRQTVRFADGVRELWRQPERILLEVGPGRTLNTLARQHTSHGPMGLVLSTLPHANAEQPDAFNLLSALGQIWLSGVPIDWSGFYAAERRQKQELPTYPFERQRYWVDAQRIAHSVNQSRAANDTAEPMQGDKPAVLSLHPRSNILTAYVAPSTEIEQALVHLWREILGIDLIGIHDNFFELGGHSLMAAQLVSRLQATFPIEVPIRRLLETPTIAQLASLIEELLIEKLDGMPDEDVDRLE